MLTRRQKAILASELIRHSADLIEEWDVAGSELNDQGFTAAEAATQIAKWLAHLPGDGWDRRLPDPDTLR
jgi:hypothetical protein